MSLLAYVMPSRARRELLKLLRSRGKGMTVRQLAREAGVAYSSAHREVRQMSQVGLVRTERVGNAVVCIWNVGSDEANALDPLLRDSGTNKVTEPDEDSVFWNLRRWGAPLARPGTPGEELSLESTLSHALGLARRHSDVARAWPVVFARNQPAVNLQSLTLLTRRLGQKRALGFFLALTRRLLNDPSLADAEKRLRDDRFRATQDFFLPVGGKRAQKLADRRTPQPAKEWHFRMNMPLESFASSFRKFASSR